jgi:hypothetical protein
MRSTTEFTARNGAEYVAAGPRWKSIHRGVVSSRIEKPPAARSFPSGVRGKKS